MKTITMRDQLNMLPHEIHAHLLVEDLGLEGAARWAIGQLERPAAEAVWRVLEVGKRGAWRAWARERLADATGLCEAAALEIVGHLADTRRLARQAARDTLEVEVADTRRLRDLHLLADAVGATVDATMPEAALCEQIDAAIERRRRQPAPTVDERDEHPTIPAA